MVEKLRQTISSSNSAFYTTNKMTPAANVTQTRSDRVRRFLWLSLDGLICIFIIAPFVVLYWRGSFQLLDIYIFPSNLKISAVISFIVGVCGTFVVNIGQNIFPRHIHSYKTVFLQILLKRIYTYVFGWIIVNHWRGRQHFCRKLFVRITVNKGKFLQWNFGKI